MIDKAEHERIFGRYERVDGRRAFLVEFEGETVDLCDPSADNIRGAYLEERQRRTSKTRDTIMSDIEPFVTGETEGWREVIGGRRDKREFMKRRDLVEFEPTMEPPSGHTPVRTEIRDTIREVMHTDTDYLEPAPLNRPDDDGNVIDEDHVVGV